eukprot:CAMPEP_0171459888 /NCGR_PEP_ID=MMETSP0945-20130129/4981_1 /TAXON_ID=109269 /ORGANISM="Vaucheria litorea, Strain CCMP2940" /LENGTH=77 /DNA_ID=CAMNT_0011985975 /DNA_START=61 /DNA_END=294 /DNA_ORIENTATION=-
MQSLLTRRSVALAPRMTSVRMTGARQMSALAGSQSVTKEVVIGLGLGFVVGGAWMVWARGQFGMLDKFNEKLRSSKE